MTGQDDVQEVDEWCAKTLHYGLMWFIMMVFVLYWLEIVVTAWTVLVNVLIAKPLVAVSHRKAASASNKTG